MSLSTGHYVNHTTFTINQALPLTLSSARASDAPTEAATLASFLRVAATLGANTVGHEAQLQSVDGGSPPTLQKAPEGLH